jgi:hypothetical protein
LQKQAERERGVSTRQDIIEHHAETATDVAVSP